MTSSTVNNNSRYEETRNVTLVSVVTNVFLSLAQLIGGVLTHSHALIADGVHTLSDLASDMVVLVAAKIASKDADDDHPYGHGRFETVATVILGLALAGVAVGIAMNAISRIMNPDSLLQPEPLALLFAGLAIISKEGLYQYTMLVAKRINSKLLKANAWHHRSDALSSIIVLSGIAGSIYLGIPWLDAGAAVVVAIIIFYMGVRLILDSTMELVDTALDPEKTSEISQFISSIEGIEQIHMLRTRRMGDTVLADVHLQVNAYLSVSEGHFIAESVIQKLRKQFPEMNDITVHIDPEDDEIVSPVQGLLSRNQLMAQLYPILQISHIDKDINNITLHYIDGMIEVEVFIQNKHESASLEQLKHSCEQLEQIRKISIYQKL